MRQIDRHPLWVGNARDARDVQALLEAGIEAVVDLAVNEPPAILTRELVYLRFPLVDGDGNPEWLLRAAVGAIRGLIRDRVPTLVACSMGLSRAPAVTAIALASEAGLRPENVLSDWMERRTTLDVSASLWRELTGIASTPRG
jgi:protein-tyrosine phosphatase